MSYNHQARALLGALLTRPSLYSKVSQHLPLPAMFGEWRTAAEYIYERAQEGRAYAYAHAQDHLGGLASELPHEAAATDDVEEYARNVRDAYLAEQETQISSAVMRRLAAGEDYWQVMQQAEAEREALHALLNSTAQDTSVIEKTLLSIEKAIHTQGLSGIPSGFKCIDDFTGGWHPGDMVIIAGRPGMGKSTVLCAFALAAARADQPVAFFSMGDMSTELLLIKMAGMITGIHPKRIRRGHLSGEEYTKIVEAMGQLSDMPLHLYDVSTCPPTAPAIRDRCRQVKERGGLGLVMIDYIQQVGMGGRQNEYERVSEVSGYLKHTAGLVGAPLLVASQLSRMVEDRGNKIPTMRDLRGSGAIEQDADTIIFPFREGYYQTEEDARADDDGATDLYFKKDRMAGDEIPFKVRLYYRNHTLSEHLDTAGAWPEAAASPVIAARAVPAEALPF